jgi:hypothetical protein
MIANPVSYLYGARSLHELAERMAELYPNSHADVWESRIRQWVKNDPYRLNKAKSICVVVSRKKGIVS